MPRVRTLYAGEGKPPLFCFHISRLQADDHGPTIKGRSRLPGCAYDHRQGSMYPSNKYKRPRKTGQGDGLKNVVDYRLRLTWIVPALRTTYATPIQSIAPVKPGAYTRNH